jgi:hypothetical protein
MLPTVLAFKGTRTLGQDEVFAPLPSALIEYLPSDGAGDEAEPIAVLLIPTGAEEPALH